MLLNACILCIFGCRNSIFSFYFLNWNRSQETGVFLVWFFISTVWKETFPLFLWIASLFCFFYSDFTSVVIDSQSYILHLIIPQQNTSERKGSFSTDSYNVGTGYVCYAPPVCQLWYIHFACSYIKCKYMLSWGYKNTCLSQHCFFAEIKVYLSFRISVQMYTKKFEKSLQITVWQAWIEMENKNEMFFELGRKFSVAGTHAIHQHINVSCTTSHHTTFIVICYIICTYLIFMFIIRLFITLLWLLDARTVPTTCMHRLYKPDGINDSSEPQDKHKSIYITSTLHMLTCSLVHNLRHTRKKKMTFDCLPCILDVQRKASSKI